MYENVHLSWIDVGEEKITGLVIKTIYTEFTIDVCGFFTCLGRKVGQKCTRLRKFLFLPLLKLSDLSACII